MDKENINMENENPLEIVKKSFGFANDQLLEQYEYAEEKVGEQEEAKDTIVQYQKIVDKIEALQIKPLHPLNQGEEGKKRVLKLKNIWKPLLIASIVGALLLGMGTTVLGRKYYVYKSRVLDNGKEIRYGNDSDIIIVNDKLGEVYKQVKGSLGDGTLKITYMPAEMLYVDSQISAELAKLTFSYDENMFYFIQTKYEVSNATTISTDCIKVADVHIDWIDQTVPIYVNNLKNNKKEFSCDFSIGDTYYSLNGIISQEEFVEIIKSLNYNK